MRILNINLLAVALLLFGATSASAFAINMTARAPTSSVSSSDTVIVDVFLDADPGLTLLSVGVLFPNDGTITYDGPASAALTPHAGAATLYGNSTGALSSYILYSGGGRSAQALYPSVDNQGDGNPGANYWNTWNGANQSGRFQVNIDYAEGSSPNQPVSATGTGIYIGTLVFHIEASLGSQARTLRLCTTCGGNVVLANGLDFQNLTTLSSAITIPEPATAMLIGLGILGLAAAGRRRA